MSATQDDLGMLWYGVPGVTYNPTDPSEVMLNSGVTAPLLSDHPRALVNPQVSQTSLTHPHQTAISYGDPSISHHNQMLYDHQSGDYINQGEYMYETYEPYEEDITVTDGINASHQLLPNQNAQDDESSFLPKTKKPKVHQNPALKLKTPIAYQKDTDLNAIPIMKEGMAVCEKCGAIGVKHAFYGKERKYCSLACARPPNQNSPFLSKLTNDLTKPICKNDFSSDMNQTNLMSNYQNQDNFTPVSKPLQETNSNLQNNSKEDDKKNMSEMCQYFQDLKKENEEASNNVAATNTDSTMSISSRATPTYLPPPSIKDGLYQSFRWESSYLQSEDFSAVPVNAFKHAPMSECWEQISPGMKVEVSCYEEASMKDAFWVATVIVLFGYKAKLRFEGFVEDESKDFWVDLCSEEVHPVGWCATQGKPLIPPVSIANKYSDWKDFLMKRLTGARTLPTNFHTKVTESLKSRFKPGLNLEVVDKNRIAQMRVATVTKVIGKRIHLRYHGAPPDDNGFWCHEDAPIIHPVGWSREVGHEIVATQAYHEKCMEVAYDPNDATSDLFVYPNKMVHSANLDLKFEEGMKLEAIDPLNLATICVATVMKVLSHNYLMIRIDSYDNDDTNSDWFCYSCASNSIFPAGFCQSNSIDLTPPRGFEGQFSWFNYLSKTKALAAPPELFTREVPNHGFCEGMSIEAADLMDPRLVCVATVKEVKGRLLKIHFDGWENDFDQWVDCSSPDIYPVGWCNLVGYKLEGPRIPVPVQFVQRKKIRGRGNRKGRPFGSRRGGALNVKGTENASPIGQTQSVVQGFSSSTAKRGRRPRVRGSASFSHPMRESNSGIEEFNFDQDSSNDISYSSNELNTFSHRSKRGRPRKNSMRIMNSDPLNSQSNRPTRAARTSLHSYIQSEDEASDETSSGVASLAGSENSSEAWDVEQYTMNTINPSSERKCDVKKDQEKSLNTELTPLPTDTGYREEARTTPFTFKSISEDNSLFDDEGPNLESFLTTSEGRLTESLPLSDSSTDFKISSSLDLKLDKLVPEKLSPSPALVNDSFPNTTVVEEIKPPDSIEEVAEPSLSHINNATSSHFELSSETSSSDDVTSQDDSGSGNEQGSQTNNVIPRIIDNSSVVRGNKIQPKLWSHYDVATFLRLNDCGAYCDNFVSQGINGEKFLILAQNEVMELTGMKVGPSLKIHDLIQQLLAIVNPAQARYQATLLKRGLAFGKS